MDSLALFAMSGSFADATREPGWEPLLIVLMITMAVAGTWGWRYARRRLGPDVPIPGTTLETTAKVARAAAQVRIAILLVGGLVLIATGIALTQINEIVIGLVGIVWSLVALRALCKSEDSKSLPLLPRRKPRLKGIVDGVGIENAGAPERFVVCALRLFAMKIEWLVDGPAHFYQQIPGIQDRVTVVRVGPLANPGPHVDEVHEQLLIFNFERMPEFD